MPSIALQRSDVIVGVDTHKDEHVAFAIDGLGGVVDEPKFFPANPDGYAAMLDWAAGLGDLHSFGVEGCGSYGSGLARFLRRHELVVREVARPPRQMSYALASNRSPTELDITGDISNPAVAMNNTLACLALRWLDLHEEIKIHTRHHV